MAKQDVSVQLFYDGQWNDADAYVRDPIGITRGRGDEQGGAVPSTLSGTLKGTDYNPKNPNSALYGIAGRNTPCRVSFDTETTITITEDFEDDDLALAFTSGGDADWVRTTDLKNSGSWSLRSASIDDDESSTVVMLLPPGATELTFWYRVASEEDFDFLNVWLDDDTDDLKVHESGAMGAWAQATIDVSAASKVTFSYVKDESTTTFADRAWIDDVVITIPTNIRGVGEVASWRPDRTVRYDADNSIGDAWTDIEAAGILRRLGQGADPLASPVNRVISAVDNLVAYWPLEDGPQATQAGTRTIGADPATVTGDVTFGDNDQLLGSKSLPTIATGGVISAAVPAYTDTGEWAVGFFMYLTTAIAANSTLFEIQTSGGVARWRLVAENASPDDAYLRAYDRDGTEIDPDLSVVQVALPFNKWTFVRIKVTDNTSFQSWQLSFVTADGTGIGHSNSVTATGGVPKGWRIPIDSNGTGSSWGHVSVFDSTSTAYLADAYKAMTGWSGETAGARFTRLCGEEGVTGSIVGDPDDTMLMGPQASDTLANLLAEIERTDGGILYEPRTSVGLAYRTRADLYNQDPVLELDWSNGDVAPPLTPVLDDQNTRNDVTAKRPSGSSARAVQETGPLNVQQPTDDDQGVGRYTTQVDANPQFDGFLPDIATWYLHLGTIDDTRFPQVTVDLVASTDLAADASAVDIGDLITVDNLPTDLYPDQLRLIVVGYAETIGSHTRTITFNCMPADAYRVFVVEDFNLGRATSEGSELSADVDSDDTSIQVETTKGPKWTTDADDLGDDGFDLSIGGERVTVHDVFGPPLNFLGANSSTFEASIGSWSAAGNATIAQSTAQAHGGTHSLAVTAIASGDMAAAHSSAGNILISGMSCSSGDTVKCSAWVRAATTGRSCQVGAQFYNSSGTSLGAPTYGTAATDSTSEWVKVTASVTAPASSSRCRLIVNIGSAAAGEVHYVDDAGVGNQTTGSTTKQTMGVTRSVNGVAKSHDAGTSVDVYRPGVFAL